MTIKQERNEINMLRDNLLQVQKNIKTACERSGRTPDEITLIAVSKTKPIEMLEEIYNEGVIDFGENKVQELTDKYENMDQGIRWHMIGHLQRNKVKYIVGKTYLIHSVDSLKLAEEINKQAEKKNVTADILIEVNIAGEDSKFGIKSKDTYDLLMEVSKLPNIRTKGLMTIAPFVSDPEENRRYFRQIKELSVDMATKNIDNVSMDILSMGMTGDYMVAIEEGATMVRVGTGIFGERNYLN